MPHGRRIQTMNALSRIGFQDMLWNETDLLIRGISHICLGVQIMNMIVFTK